MKLGFIGTGKITSAVITGICTSKISFKKILISSRNRNIAQKLKKRFRKVNIAKNNQEVVDKCNWIFLAVTPRVGEKILSKLEYKSNQKIRQPLRKALYAIENDETSLFIERNREIILEELNVKEIERITNSDKLISYKIQDETRSRANLDH